MTAEAAQDLDQHAHRETLGVPGRAGPGQSTGFGVAGPFIVTIDRDDPTPFDINSDYCGSRLFTFALFLPSRAPVPRPDDE